MKRKLSEQQFNEALKTLDIGQQTKQIAYGVLVEGMPLTHYHKTIGITKSAVSQAVNRVWRAHCRISIPKGYEAVSAILPEHQAFQVKKWSKDAKKKLRIE